MFGSRDLFTPEHQKFREDFRRFLSNHVEPFQAEWRAKGCVSREVWRQAGDAGFLCVGAAPEHGGRGLDFLFTLAMCEELSRIHEVGFALPLHSEVVVPYIEQLGTSEQRRRYLPRCVRGDCITAFAMTEPTGGSDVATLQTTATRDAATGEWVINGEKTFIANGQLCDLVLVVATDPEAPRPHWGLSLFLVEAETPGFERGRNLPTIGMAGQDTSELRFRDCRVPADSLLGQEGRGFQYVMERLPRERIIVTVSAQARAERVFQDTLDYIKKRKLFGRTLGALQDPAFTMAHCSTQLAAGRAFAESLILSYLHEEDVTVSSAMTKLWHTEMLFDVANRCVQLWGAHGTDRDNGVARAFVDARMQRIYAGSNEVMKLIVARSLGLGE